MIAGDWLTDLFGGAIALALLAIGRSRNRLSSTQVFGRSVWWWSSVTERNEHAMGALSAKVIHMRWLLVPLCLAPSFLWAWEFTPTPICALSKEADRSSVIVTYDPRVPEYAIAIKRALPWPRDAVFAIRFEGPGGRTISTTRHRLSEGGTVLTVTDRGFGNVLDGLQYNHTAVALTGSTSHSVSLDGAASAVEKFRACTTAPSV